MATRRARIKAVAALPVRRKNTDGSRSDQPENSLKKQDNTCTETEVKVDENHVNSNQIETVTVSTNYNQCNLISPEIEINSNITAEKIFDCLENEKGLIIPDDYNPGSVPESIADETLVDGIVPIKSTQNTPKNIDLLKSNITDNAEILFDPIVPLPSPSKVRPKLRPVPRLRPNRRNSIQGSASESEDESRRALLSGAPTPTPIRQRHDSHTQHSTLQAAPNREVNRVRNDSVCSSVGQMTPLANVSSPLKEKIAKVRRDENSRRLAAMRRLRENVQREKLTMYDLIFYNPITNPMIEDKDELKVKEMNMKCEAEKQEKDVESSESAEEGGDSAPVPQLKLGPNGEIVIDEKSLVIAQSHRRLARGVVHEGASGGRVGHYSRTRRTREWRPRETIRFYRALAALGTDFSLMTDLFPDRTRKDLKTKFKKEEKVNPVQIEMALRTPTTWDAMQLSKEFREQREEEVRKDMLERKKLEEIKLQEKERLQRLKNMNIKQSRATKAIRHEIDASVSQPNTPTSGDEFLKRKLKEKSKRKHLPPSDNVDSIFVLEENSEIRPLTTQSGVTPTEPVKSIQVESNTEKQKQYASLTLVEDKQPSASVITIPIDLEQNMETVSRLASGQLNNPTTVTDNIETGSLVLLTVDDPSSTSSKVVQTYISNSGCLTPVALPQSLWDSLVDYVWKDPSKTDSPAKSNTNTVSQEQPSVIQPNPSANKRTPNNYTSL